MCSYYLLQIIAAYAQLVMPRVHNRARYTLSATDRRPTYPDQGNSAQPLHRLAVVPDVHTPKQEVSYCFLQAKLACRQQTENESMLTNLPSDATKTLWCDAQVRSNILQRYPVQDLGLLGK